MTRVVTSGVFLIALVAAGATAASAQSTSLTGSVSALLDVLPHVPRAETIAEVRVRAVADFRGELQPWLRFQLAAEADGLAANRGGAVRDANVEPLEAWLELGGARGDVRVGFGRIPWGRLDELQPTDVVNPIDVARFLLEGRSEARRPVAFVRGRVFAGDAFFVEGVLVPLFRPGTFDRLDEPTSPFNLFRDLPPPPCPSGIACPTFWMFTREEPEAGEMQGGARVGITRGRIDWSLSAWRGFVPFPLIGGSAADRAGTLRLIHPRYTMFGADMETVRGKWAWRAEAAWFPDRPMQREGEARTFDGDSLELGAGGDRRAGDFTLSATLLLRLTETPARATDTNVSVLGALGRSFSHERFETRLFTLVNPADAAVFIRGIAAWKPADDLSFESSIGWFAGEGDDVVTRFGDRDFAYMRVKYFFGR